MSLLPGRSACWNFSHVSALWPPLQNGQPLAATTANAAAVDLMRSADLRSGRNGFDEGVRSSCLDADGLVSSPLDVESSPACHCANSRNFCKLSSSWVASGPMLVSQALISAGGGTCPATSASGLRLRADDRRTDLCLEL
ncbi:hypothetical protein T09_6076 [Trichinella sp. T9]|nr:hypothetical protein T09_6076 [Trichinella sp. T9]